MSDEKFWLSFSTIAGITLVLISFTIKGCNDSDNEMFKVLISKGCSRITVPGGDHDWKCP